MLNDKFNKDELINLIFTLAADNIDEIIKGLRERREIDKPFNESTKKITEEKLKKDINTFREDSKERIENIRIEREKNYIKSMLLDKEQEYNKMAWEKEKKARSKGIKTLTLLFEDSGELSKILQELSEMSSKHNWGETILEYYQKEDGCVLKIQAKDYEKAISGILDNYKDIKLINLVKEKSSKSPGTEGYGEYIGNIEYIMNLVVIKNIALIITELSEAIEAIRKGKINTNENFEKDSFQDELADTCMRIFDLCGFLNIDLERCINQKMEYNKSREYLHGKEF